MRILVITLDAKLAFETHLREVMSNAAKSLSVVRRAGSLYGCPSVLKSCFNAYVLKQHLSPAWSNTVDHSFKSYLLSELHGYKSQFLESGFTNVLQEISS